MKKESYRQLLVALIGALMCRFGIYGYYPFVPAYYAAALLCGEGRLLLTGVTFAGMALTLPVTATVRYAIGMIITWMVVKICEWIDHKCLTVTAAIASAVVTVSLNICGELLTNTVRGDLPVKLMEGVICFASVFVFARLLYWLPLLVERLPEPHADRGTDENRLMGYADSFGELAQLFSGMNTVKKDFTSEEMGKIHNEITGHICTSCAQCTLCWEKSDAPMYQALAGYLTSIHQAGKAAKEAKEQLEQHCIRSEALAMEATRVFERARLNLAWYNRLLENRAVIAEQMEAMAYIMQDCTKDAIDLTKKEKPALTTLRYLAKEQGILLQNIRLMEKKNGRITLSVEARSKQGNCISAKDLTKVVERALDLDMVLHRDSKSLIGKLPGPFVFEEDTLYHSTYGIARLIRDGAAVSGDNFSYVENHDGQALLMLSDGMGSGSSACKESEMVLELMERFLEAGFSEETALRMLNAACVLHDQEDSYSTMDICEIDLYQGDVAFYKIGAAAAFIKRGEEAECIPCANLPVGADMELQIETKHSHVSGGDYVILMTDGVLEHLHVPLPEQTMCEILESIHQSNPNEMAKKILERVSLFTGGQVRDDMTVLVAGIWEK
ncbi:MAG: SpoIIE family protein phosphatase [bacterium]|nr:SpoIIE family protein phosphatase [bacterium]MDY4101236.1 SpoIIE family protein phosphatase [Lachnospiraceae bacterium]